MIVSVLSLVETVHAVQLIANGGFELGDTQWETIGSIGRSSATNQFSKGGKFSLLTSNLPPYQAVPTATYRQGAYQDVPGADPHGGLAFAFWVRPRQTSQEVNIFADVNFIVRDQAGMVENLTISFYVSWRTGKVPANASAAKHVLLAKILPQSVGWDAWNFFSRDLASDLYKLFPERAMRVVLAIRVSVHVLTLTTVSSTQPVFWDDIGLEAGSPLIPYMGLMAPPGENTNQACACEKTSNMRPPSYSRCS
jgi:hypothetical protein